jgi:hypothetical protein
MIYPHLPSFTYIYHHLPTFTIIYHHLPHIFHRFPTVLYDSCSSFKGIAKGSREAPGPNGPMAASAEAVSQALQEPHGILPGIHGD